MREFNIVYCCSDYYAPHLGASITSILENVRVKNTINFHILDFEISHKNKAKLQLICDKYNALNHIFLYDNLADSAKKVPDSANAESTITESPIGGGR